MLTERDPEGLARQSYDLIVVGGGVHGIMVALEAVRRGLRPLLVERADFAGATSYNSLRIVHGGLRYLQSLDLPRFRESVAERRWLLRHFPDLVVPLACLLPLTGEGLRRPAVLRAAMLMNDALSLSRNLGMPAGRALPAGRVLDATQTRAIFPAIDAHGLRGAAVWHDACIPNAPRLHIEALSWACAYGACALNYVEARAPLVSGGRITGLRARDVLQGRELEFRAPLVVNAAGPWAAQFAAQCEARHDNLFVPALAWNVVFRCAPPSDHALGVTPPRPGAQTYFLVPWKGVVMAGTGHAPWAGPVETPRLSPSLLRAFIADLDAAVPGLELGERQVVRVFAGLVPAVRPEVAEPSTREVILDHGARGGPAGLFSLSGVKLTTARRVADKALARAIPAARPIPYSRFRRPPVGTAHPDHPFVWLPPAGDDGWKAPLRRAVAEEAVYHLDDLLLRRSSLGDNPERAVALAAQACTLFDWPPQRAAHEVEALRTSLAEFRDGA